MVELSGETETFWHRFLQHTNRDAKTVCFDCFHFDCTEESANALLQLVLDGTKTATASSLDSFARSGLALPQVGDLSIVTDWEGVPRCVIQTTCITQLPFRDMTFEICKREGEDDCLASWREGHIRFFTREGELQGYAFTWDMTVVFEDFEVVYTE